MGFQGVGAAKALLMQRCEILYRVVQKKYYWRQ